MVGSTKRDSEELSESLSSLYENAHDLPEVLLRWPKNLGIDFAFICRKQIAQIYVRPLIRPSTKYLRNSSMNNLSYILLYIYIFVRHSYFSLMPERLVISKHSSIDLEPFLEPSTPQIAQTTNRVSSSYFLEYWAASLDNPVLDVNGGGLLSRYKSRSSLHSFRLQLVTEIRLYYVSLWH